MFRQSIVLRKVGGVLHACWSRSQWPAVGGSITRAPSLLATALVAVVMLFVPLAALGLLALLASHAPAHVSALGGLAFAGTIDTAAVTAEVEKLGHVVAEFRAENDKRIKEIETKGAATAETETKVNKLNDRISELEASLNRLRLGGGADADPETPEAKSLKAKLLAFFHPKSEEDAMRQAKFTLSFDRGESLRNMQIEARRTGRVPEVQAAQSTSGTAGGDLIAPSFSAQLERALLFFSGMMQESTIMTTDTGVDLPWPTVNDTGNVGAILAENATISAQDATFAQTTLHAYKYTSKLIAVSWELLQDSFFDIPALVGSLGGERLGRILNTHFTTGTGSSQPNGVVTAATSGKVGTTGQTSTVIYDDLVDLVYSVDIAYRAGAIFMLNDASIKVIRKLKDGQNRPLWEPSYQSGMVSGAQQMLLGHRIVTNNDVATMAANAKSILFGDFSRYKIRRVREIQLVRLNERYADNLQTGFFAFCRFDGNLIDAGTHPIKYYANSAT